MSERKFNGYSVLGSDGLWCIEDHVGGSEDPRRAQRWLSEEAAISARDKWCPDGSVVENPTPIPEVAVPAPPSQPLRGVGTIMPVSWDIKVTRDGERATLDYTEVLPPDTPAEVIRFTVEAVRTMMQGSGNEIDVDGLTIRVRARVPS